MKINDRIVGGLMAAALMAALAGGVVTVATAAQGEPAVVVETEAPIDYGTDNGLAAEQEAEAAAAVEAQRIADEANAAELARLAAEAAAIEAERVAAETEPESFEGEPEPVAENPTVSPAPEWDVTTQPHAICEVLADGTQIPCQ